MAESGELIITFSEPENQPIYERSTSWFPSVVRRIKTLIYSHKAVVHVDFGRPIMAIGVTLLPK
ncbi:hypothetical protein CS022_13975 [Veronia nyctiphanis]|uniref:Uncharacterized protein n=1 Tax=Veronia nyctiphanis TaxID=1278244 RepID=A0A4Q0YU73_9GAMM|nr:hypothetical protein CS022_13975 [Veronia nyctiphanis]